MAEENSSAELNGESPKKKQLNLSIVFKPVAEIDTSIGKLFLFPLRVSDVGEYAKLSGLASFERIKAFLPCIASLSADYSLGHNRVAITAGEVEQLSVQDLEAIAEAYALSNALREAREGGKDREPLVRETGEPATAFLDRLLSKEIEEQATQFRKQREEFLGSARGIFDQVRKSSEELGDTRRQFERLTKASAFPKDLSPAIETKSLEVSNHLVEHTARLARERAEDREIVRLTGQMSAQSAKTLQELAVAASTLLEKFDLRDEEAKRTTKFQLWIAVVSVAISALLAGASFLQDRSNNASGDRWQADLLSEVRASNQRRNALENEVKKLRDRVAELDAQRQTVKDVKSVASAVHPKP